METETSRKSNQKQPKNSVLQFVPSKFKLHIFSTEFSEKQIIFQVIKLVDSCIIFINYGDNLTLSDLSLGMFNNICSTAIGTRIIGNFTDETSKTMAIKFAKRLKKVVYISSNVSMDRLLLPVIEKRLCDELTTNPDKF